MASLEQEIGQRIIDLMAADSTFNSIEAFFLGTPATIPAEFMPAVEVVVLVGNRLEVRTGGRQKWEYLGQIRLYQNFQDAVEVVNRKAVVQSYADIYTWTQGIRDLFQIQANKSLAGLSGSGYTIIEIQVARGEYGIQTPEARVETWENHGVVDFRVTTLET